jgi:ADP-ribose pyrophosphatase
MDFQVLNSQIMFRGRVFDVRRENVRYPDGRVVVTDIVAHSGAAAMLPVDDEGRALLVRQYRHATGGMLLEIPAGTLEEGEAPEACAQRELREEVGVGAGELIRLGEFFTAPGFSTEKMVLFLARDLTADQAEPDKDEVLSVERMPLDEVWAKVEAGEILDAKTLLALHMAGPYLEAK